MHWMQNLPSPSALNFAGSSYGNGNAFCLRGPSELSGREATQLKMWDLETACHNACLLEGSVQGALGELWFHQSRLRNVGNRCNRHDALQRARGYLISRLENAGKEVADDEIAWLHTWLNRVLDAQNDWVACRSWAEKCIARGVLWEHPCQRPGHFVPGLKSQPWHCASHFELCWRLESSYESIKGRAACPSGYLLGPCWWKSNPRRRTNLRGRVAWSRPFGRLRGVLCESPALPRDKYRSGIQAWSCRMRPPRSGRSLVFIAQTADEAADALRANQHSSHLPFGIDYTGRLPHYSRRPGTKNMEGGEVSCFRWFFWALSWEQFRPKPHHPLGELLASWNLPNWVACPSIPSFRYSMTLSKASWLHRWHVKGARRYEIFRSNVSKVSNA